MTGFADLAAAVHKHVTPGSTVALEGFSHLVPFAAGREIIRQGLTDLTLVRMVPDIIVDQMIGTGCVSSLVFSWAGNPGLGSLYRLRDAVENAWPRPLRLEEHTHAELANRFVAGAAHVPFTVMRGRPVGDLSRRSPQVADITCPFTQQPATAVRAINPDVTIVHAQAADTAGNVCIQGVTGVQKEAALAARTTIATVEHVVDTLPRGTNQVILPHWSLAEVCVTPRGSWPSYTLGGGYQRADDFYRRWRDISRSRDGFLDWMRRDLADSEHGPQPQGIAG